MPNYRRVYVPGGTYFLTLVTYRRRPLFKDPGNIHLLRSAIAKVKANKPFEIIAAVILPDHLHFIWQLPADDSDYSQRFGRVGMAKFTTVADYDRNATANLIFLYLN